jgi:hypothetical protein
MIIVAVHDLLPIVVVPAHQLIVDVLFLLALPQLTLLEFLLAMFPLAPLLLAALPLALSLLNLLLLELVLLVIALTLLALFLLLLAPTLLTMLLCALLALVLSDVLGKQPVFGSDFCDDLAQCDDLLCRLRRYSIVSTGGVRGFRQCEQVCGCCGGWKLRCWVCCLLFVVVVVVVVVVAVVWPIFREAGSAR